MEFDLHSAVKAIHCVPPAVLAADANGAVIDTQQNERFESLEYIINVGVAFVGGGFDITLEESDVVTFGGEETAVSAANTIGALPQVVITDANTVFRVGSRGKKRFQRIVLTETGTISAGAIGVVAVLSHAITKPVPDQSVT